MSNRKDLVSIRMASFVAIFCLLIIVPTGAQNIEWSPPNSSEYSNTANGIADIYINDIKSDNPGDQIAFFVGDEIRGLSTPIQIGNSEYVHFVTIYSNQAVEDMDMRVYSQSQDLVFDVAEDFDFETSRIYGSIDDPLNVNVYDDNDYPILLNSVPNQITLEGIPFNAIDMVDYLVQFDMVDINWSFTSNTNLDVSFTNGILQVDGIEGFSGTTNLIVRATKSTNNSFVETSISFTITSFYEGPAWNNIPPQGIVIGDQFDPLNLHDFEFQYGGPAIQYDYIPILLPNNNPTPKPTWTVTSKNQVNMNLIIQMDYTPKYHFQHKDDLLAAFVDEEIRGVARVDSNSGLFFLTVGGSAKENSSFTLKFYSGEKKQIYTLSEAYNFQPYFVSGSVSQPNIIDLAPILPTVPEFPVPGGIASVPIDIIDTEFIGIEHFRFFAYDPLYPEYLHADTTTSFCIAATIGELFTQYADFDLDGLGNPDVTIQACEGVLNYVPNNDDCDDTNYLECAADITVSNDPGFCEATGVSLIDPIFNDCNVTLITNDAPLVYPLGSTLVRWTVTFNETATKSCSQIVTVIDDEAPVPDIGGTTVTWDEISTIVASDGEENQQFGHAVAISNEWAVVGARFDDELGTEAGAAYMLWFDGSTWVQHSKLLASNGVKLDGFGTSVSISENRVLVGAPGNDTGGQEAGAAYVFDFDGISWIETALLVASNASDNDLFGGSVSVHYDYAVIGSVEEDSEAINSGAVYVFEKKNIWLENGFLKANDAESDDEFGCDVSVSGDYIIIGAKQEDSDGVNSGAAYIFKRDEDLGNWFQSEKLTVNNPEIESKFGSSVDISGNHVIVGSPQNDTNGQDYGIALVYSRSGNIWVEEQVIQPVGLQQNNEFGTSVSISANYIVVGAPFNVSSEPSEGASYIFRNDDQEWNLQSSVFASNSEKRNLFGSAVAIYGHNALIGAYGMDNPLIDGGQSYVFKLDAGLPLNNSACAVEFDPPSSFDNCDGAIEGIIEETSSYIGNGFFEILWSYTDNSDNTSFQYQMVQTLQDTIDPEISCPFELVLFLDNSGNLLVELADSVITSTDNCGMLTVDYFPSSFDCSDLGPTLVEVTVEDAIGNQSSCQIEVMLQESPKLVTNLSNNQPGSLRKLIEGSCGGAESIIYFDTILNGTIQLFTNQILIDKDLEIVGLGKDIINIDPKNTMRIFEISPSSNVTLRGLQLSNGEEILEGGAILNKGILNLDNVRFIGNREDGSGKAFTNGGVIKIIGGLVEVKE
ncbi:MAG: hypothetical protein ACJATI_004860 [Halioglobus sp.]|jgi:hypothetical protein